MKTTCPHCQGEIIIHVQCCNGGNAIVGIFTTEQYEEKLKNAEIEEKIKQEKHDQYKTALAEFTIEYCKGRSLMNKRFSATVLIIGFFMAIVPLIIVVVLSEISGTKCSDEIFVFILFGEMLMLIGVILLY